MTQLTETFDGKLKTIKDNMNSFEMEYKSGISTKTLNRYIQGKTTPGINEMKKLIKAIDDPYMKSELLKLWLEKTIGLDNLL